MKFLRQIIILKILITYDTRKNCDGLYSLKTFLLKPLVKFNIDDGVQKWDTVDRLEI